MKKLSFLFVLALLCGTVYSQGTLIPKVGISLANVSVSDDLTSDDEDYKSKVGFIVGLGYELSFSDNLSLQPELLFHQKGTTNTYEVSSYSEELKITLNYLELPVMLKYKFSNLYLSAGPYFAFGIGGSYKYEDSSGGEADGKVKFGDEPDNYDGDDFYIENGFDVGLGVGIGYKLLGKIIIDVRYGLGFSNLSDEPQGFTGDWKQKNGSLQFTVGIPLGGK